MCDESVFDSGTLTDLQKGVSKSVVHMIKHVNFQLYRYILAELVGETDYWQQLYKQRSSGFYTSSGVSPKSCAQKKGLRFFITVTFLYKSVEVLTSTSAYRIAV